MIILLLQLLTSLSGAGSPLGFGVEEDTFLHFRRGRGVANCCEIK